LSALQGRPLDHRSEANADADGATPLSGVLTRVRETAGQLDSRKLSRAVSLYAKSAFRHLHLQIPE